jgi:hypothetical protein
MSDFIEANSDEIMLRSMTNVFVEKKLDPVGKEDADIDNDGDTDKSDKYLHNRRKAIGAAIAAEKGKKKAVKEEMEEYLRSKVASINEGVKLHKSEKATTSDEKAVEIVEKEVKNKVTVNPVMGESVASMIQSMYERKYMGEGLKQARKNVGASTCWDGYTAKGTKKKNGKEVPNCVKEEDEQINEATPGEKTFDKATSPELQKKTHKMGTAVGQGVKDHIGGLAQGAFGKKTKSKNPVTQVGNAVTRTLSSPARAAAGYATGLVRGLANSYEPEGNLVDEESCGSDKKMNIRGYNSDEQKKRLEKKRGMKLDDHPQYKKDDTEKK